MKKISAKLIKDCKNKLEKIREDYQKKLSQPSSVSATSSEIIEVASFNQQLQSSSFIRRKMLETLPEIERALRKIQIGKFGLCERSGEPINPKRLKAVPWTRFDIDSI